MVGWELGMKEEYSWEPKLELPKDMRNVCVPLLYAYVIVFSMFSAPLWHNVEDVGFKG